MIDRVREWLGGDTSAMRRRLSVGALLLVPYLVFAGALTLLWNDPGGAISTLRNLVFDEFQRQKPRTFQDPAAVAGVAVRYVDIDEESLKRLGQWPWPRTTLAELIDRAREKGAALLAFDIVFSEPDRTSPDQIARTLPAGENFDALRPVLTALPSNDSVFAAALPTMPTVTGVILTQDPGAGPAPAPRRGIAFVGSQNPRSVLPPFPNALVNLPELEQASLGTGALNTLGDRDGLIRRVPMILSSGEDVVPSLTLEIVRALQERGSIVVKTAGASDASSFGAQSGIVSVRAGQITIPTDPAGELWVHYGPPRDDRVIPAWQLLDGSIDPARIQNAILILGTSAGGLRDIRATPINPAMAGVEVHVQVLEQILTGHFLTRPDYARGLEVVAAALVGVLVLILVASLPSWVGGIIALTAMLGGVAFSWMMFADNLALIDPVGPGLVVALTYIAAAGARFVRTEADRDFVRRAFSRYVAKDVVEALAKNPERLRLGGENRLMTILFCDIRGFTRISEVYKDDPERLTQLVNRVMTPISRVVLEHKGTIDKYMGDALMAFWNAPLDDPDHAQNACECAMKMLEALERVNEMLEREHQAEGRPFKPVEIGFGLNTGRVVVGNMGSEDRFAYTVLGDAVNISQRIQALSGSYGPAVIVGEETRKAAERHFAFLEVDYISVKGKNEPIHLYALLGNPLIRTSPKFRALETFHNHIFAAYRTQQWDRALDLIRECRQLSGASQALYDLYESRIAFYRNNPPGPEWDGAWRALVKEH